MPVTCPIDLDTARLRKEIQSIYARVASAPDGEFHFHRGAEYAERLLRYEPLALARVPPFAVEKVALKYRVGGVNVHAAKRQE
jgi:arsenite methyltransferase